MALVFQMDAITALPPEQRLSAHLDQIAPRRLAGNSLWAPVGATLVLVGGVSWGGREFPRPATDELAPLVLPNALVLFRIDDRELNSDAVSILKWPKKGTRSNFFRTENQNVLSWAGASKSNAPDENRIFRAINLLCLNYHVDLIPVYVRSGDSIAADGLTRRSERGVDDWSPPHEGMVRINAVDELRPHMSLHYNDVSLSPTLRWAFATLAGISHFPQENCRYRVCEFGCSNCDIAGLLGSWGAPVILDQLPGRSVYDIRVRRTLQPISDISDRAAFLLVGCC